MSNAIEFIKRHRVFIIFGLYVVAYALLVLIPKPDPATTAHYHLSDVRTRWLEVTLIVPVALIWFAAFYGYDRLNKYSQLIKNTRDGKNLARIALGLAILAFISPLATLLSSAANLYVRTHADWQPTETIIRNYLNLLIPLAAIIIISRGARGLSEFVKSQVTKFSREVLVILFIFIGVMYCFLVLKNSAASLLGSNQQIYYLPDWLVMFTVVGPYLYVWFTGMVAVAELLVYNKATKGIIYRQGIGYITYGFLGVIAGSIVIQYITSLAGRLTRLHLNSLLGLIYVLLIVEAAGYVLVAWGAKKLQKIEEV